MRKYDKGRIVKGSVSGIQKYGAFVTLDNKQNGLIHISEISNDYVRNINDYVELGETIYMKVLDTDRKTNHVTLSIKDIEYRKDSDKYHKIIETEEGFLSLRDNLNAWIKDKMAEISKKRI